MTAAIDGYVGPSLERWTGRIDDESDRAAMRWHQVVQPLDLTNAGRRDLDGFGVCFLGYASDHGVRRNRGRPGAVRGPDSIRSQLGNLPVTFGESVHLLDAGDIRCDGDVEAAQLALADAVERIAGLGLHPAVLGGGHDLAYGHWLGLTRTVPSSERLGIVNFDAHLDLRPATDGANSGTSFAQIADRCHGLGEPLRYMCVGAQRSANTVRLFRRADELGVEVVLARDVERASTGEIERRIEAFLDRVDRVYLSVDVDVMSSAFVPGVSAPQPLGLAPATALELVRCVVARGTTVSFDLAEVSPRFDNDNNTAKVAAVLVDALVRALLAPAQRID